MTYEENYFKTKIFDISVFDICKELQMFLALLILFLSMTAHFLNTNKTAVNSSSYCRRRNYVHLCTEMKISDTYL